MSVCIRSRWHSALVLPPLSAAVRRLNVRIPQRRFISIRATPALRIRRRKTSQLSETHIAADTAPLSSARVALFGRCNVGKSALFNRLCGRKLALTDAVGGTTRDCRDGAADIAGMTFDLTDTPGSDGGVDADNAELMSAMRAAREFALSRCDIAAVVYDARAPLTDADRAIAQWIRRHVRPRTKPVVVIANKAENDDGNGAGIASGYQLGFGRPIAVSAEHNEGMAALHNALQPHIASAVAAKRSHTPHAFRDRIGVALVGATNVGKSSLVNALVGTERVITSSMPRTTRDSISVDWTSPSAPDYCFRLEDTAGLTGTSGISHSAHGTVDAAAMTQTLAVIDRANVVAIVFDVNRGIGAPNMRSDKHYSPKERAELMRTRVVGVIGSDELTIARRVLAEGRALVFVANKIDLIPTSERATVIEAIGESLRTFLPAGASTHVPVIPMSAKTKDGVDTFSRVIAASFSRWSKRISTHRLNVWLQSYQRFKSAPSSSHPVRIRYATQISTRPPTFVLFVNRQKSVNAEWIKHIGRIMRAEFGLGGVPIRIRLRSDGEADTDNETRKSRRQVDSDQIDGDNHDDAYSDSVMDEDETNMQEGSTIQLNALSEETQSSPLPRTSTTPSAIVSSAMMAAAVESSALTDRLPPLLPYMRMSGRVLVRPSGYGLSFKQLLAPMTSAVSAPASMDWSQRKHANAMRTAPAAIELSSKRMSERFVSDAAYVKYLITDRSVRRHKHDRANAKEKRARRNIDKQKQNA